MRLCAVERHHPPAVRACRGLRNRGVEGMKKRDIVDRVAGEAGITKQAAEAAVGSVLRVHRRGGRTRRRRHHRGLRQARADRAAGARRQKPAHRRAHRHRPVVRGVVQGRQGTQGRAELMPAEPPTGRRFINDFQRGVRRRETAKRFRAADVRRACPRWSERTYSNFLSKHRVGSGQVNLRNSAYRVMFFPGSVGSFMWPETWGPITRVRSRRLECQQDSDLARARCGKDILQFSAKYNECSNCRMDSPYRC